MNKRVTLKTSGVFDRYFSAYSKENYEVQFLEITMPRGSTLQSIKRYKEHRYWRIVTLYSELYSFSISASHADVLRGSSRVPAPRTSADLSGKKRRPISADFQILQSYRVTPPFHHPKSNFMSKRHLIQPLQIYNNPSLIS